MLTKRQNFLETIRGGNPDRFVNQYEALALVPGGPISGFDFASIVPGKLFKTNWGVTFMLKEGQPGIFPLHDEEHVVIKDITKWRDYVKFPKTDYPDEAWKPFEDMANAIDRNEYFVTVMAAPGVFEMTHHLQGMENALINYYEEPEAMHELIDFITEFELEYARQVIEHLHPDALFHHDDWGSAYNSFLSPEMFEEFIVPAYKKIYGYYKANGVEVIVHHSDSYAANLVPYMIEMGIDVWQGCTSNNNVPELIKKYGGQISFMGNIDNAKIDVPDWTPELIASTVEKACRECGKKYFIPCGVMGGPESTYKGVYEAVSAEIDRMSKIMF